MIRGYLWPRVLLAACAVVVAAWILLIVFAVRAAFAAGPRWQTAVAVGYSTSENLTGCYAPGKCRMACGGLLDDGLNTVAANPKLGLRCSQRITVCGLLGKRGHWRCRKAIVRDVTLSRFEFEFTKNLSYATGAVDWAGPRKIVWRRGW